MMPIWRDPAPGKLKSWRARLEPLKARPGRWALVHTCPTKSTAHSTAGKLRRGERFRVPEGRWEFKADGKNVHARYMGEE